ncbi:hypothetical protein, partial [Pseudoalteromonas sp.]|uniref:hypothetical protein n=1 Tax=Pseudoalteromonas sp. TaxID=53249 RepID=UPI003565FAD2
THSLAKLTSLKAGIYYQIERLDDQLSVAFDESDIRSKLLSSGISSNQITIEEFCVENELFCWKVIISKSF